MSSSNPRTVNSPKVDVHISKETGGAYADVRQVIESEIARIKEEYGKQGSTGNTRSDNKTNGDDQNI